MTRAAFALALTASERGALAGRSVLGAWVGRAPCTSRECTGVPGRVGAVSGARLVARLVLIAVFALSGGAKLADLDGARRAARDLGVPARLAGVVGVALPIVELTAVGLLVFAATAWWG